MVVCKWVVCKWILLCRFSHVPLFATPWAVTHQAPLSWDSPSKNTGVVCHSLLQGIFPTQGYNSLLLHWLVILYKLSYEGSPNRFASIDAEKAFDKIQNSHMMKKTLSKMGI